MKITVDPMSELPGRKNGLSCEEKHEAQTNSENWKLRNSPSIKHREGDVKEKV